KESLPSSRLFASHPHNRSPNLGPHASARRRAFHQTELSFFVGVAHAAQDNPHHLCFVALRISVDRHFHAHANFRHERNLLEQTALQRALPANIRRNPLRSIAPEFSASKNSNAHVASIFQKCANNSINVLW